MSLLRNVINIRCFVTSLIAPPASKTSYLETSPYVEMHLSFLYVFLLQAVKRYFISFVALFLCFCFFPLIFLYMTVSLDGVEDVFFSMADMDMSHSLSSLPPLGDPPTVDLDLSLTSNYSASPGESPSGNAAVGLRVNMNTNTMKCFLFCTLCNARLYKILSHV